MNGPCVKQSDHDNYVWTNSIGETFQIKIIFEKEKSLALNADVLWNNNNVPRDQVVARGMKVRFLQLSKDERQFLKDIVAET